MSDKIKQYLIVVVKLATLSFVAVILYSLFGVDNSLEFISNMQLKKISIQVLIMSLTMPIIWEKLIQFLMF